MVYGYRYESTGTKCAKGPQPGAVALGKWLKARFGLPLVGIFNCRPSRSGTSLSTHGEGRGIDAHVHVRASEAPPTAAEKAIGDEMFVLMIALAPLLGVQAVIWLDQRWDARTRLIKHYGGPFHGNHVHIELCRAAARGLTVEAIDTAAGGSRPPQEDDMANWYPFTLHKIGGDDTVWRVPADGDVKIRLDKSGLAVARNQLDAAGVDPSFNGAKDHVKRDDAGSDYDYWLRGLPEIAG